MGGRVPHDQEDRDEWNLQAAEVTGVSSFSVLLETGLRSYEPLAFRSGCRILAKQGLGTDEIGPRLTKIGMRPPRDSLPRRSPKAKDGAPTDVERPKYVRPQTAATGGGRFTDNAKLVPAPPKGSRTVPNPKLLQRTRTRRPALPPELGASPSRTTPPPDTVVGCSQTPRPEGGPLS